MGGMASQMTSLTIVYSAVHLGADQRKHQSYVRGIQTGEFPAQKANNAEDVSFWWSHYEKQRNIKTQCIM